MFAHSGATVYYCILPGNAVTIPLQEVKLRSSISAASSPPAPDVWQESQAVQFMLVLQYSRLVLAPAMLCQGLVLEPVSVSNWMDSGCLRLVEFYLLDDTGGFFSHLQVGFTSTRYADI